MRDFFKAAMGILMGTTEILYPEVENTGAIDSNQLDQVENLIRNDIQNILVRLRNSGHHNSNILEDFEQTYHLLTKELDELGASDHINPAVKAKLSYKAYTFRSTLRKHETF